MTTPEDRPPCERCELGDHELSDENICSECEEEAKHMRQLISDYYASR